MSRVRTLVAVAVCAVATLGLSAAGADAHPESRLRAAEAAKGMVTSLAVLPASGRAEVIITLDEHTKLQHFTLRSPERVVLDISGVSLGLPARGYDRVDRGGIRDVRWSQFSSNVVRIVLTLDQRRDIAAHQVGRKRGLRRG